MRHFRTTKIKGIPVAWLIDGNGRLQASSRPGRIGTVVDGRFNLPIVGMTTSNITRGQTLGQKLEEMDMWIPATFRKYVAKTDVVSQGTFQRLAGKRPICIDHIVLSRIGFEVKPKSAMVMEDLDMRNIKNDHTPVAITIKCTVCEDQAPFRVRKAKYARERTRIEPFALNVAKR